MLNDAINSGVIGGKECTLSVVVLPLALPLFWCCNRFVGCAALQLSCGRDPTRRVAMMWRLMQDKDLANMSEHMLWELRNNCSIVPNNPVGIWPSLAVYIDVTWCYCILWDALNISLSHIMLQNGWKCSMEDRSSRGTGQTIFLIPSLTGIGSQSQLEVIGISQTCQWFPMASISSINWFPPNMQNTSLDLQY